jgi:hypothetical protein
VLAAHGTTITATFYPILFRDFPQVRPRAPPHTPRVVTGGVSAICASPHHTAPRAAHRTRVIFTRTPRIRHHDHAHPAPRCPRIGARAPVAAPPAPRSLSFHPITKHRRARPAALRPVHRHVHVLDVRLSTWRAA